MATLAESFFKLFACLDKGYGIYHPPKTKPVPGQKWADHGQTVKGKPTIKHWQEHLAGKTMFGAVPILSDNTCRFAAIDVDRYDINLTELHTKVKAKGLPLCVLRTKSGGAHLYLFLKEPVSALKVRGKLKEFSVLLGEFKVEIFPKQNRLAKTDDDFGSWVNMPYFAAESKGGTVRYCVGEDGQPLSAKEFLTLADSLSVTEKELMAAGTVVSDGSPTTVQSSDTTSLSDAPPCLQALVAEAFPQGSRNIGLFSLGVYARMKFPDTWDDVLAEMNQQCFQPPLPLGEVASVTKSLRRKKFFYTCDQSPLIQYCNKSVCRTRKFGIAGDGSEGITISSPIQYVRTGTSDPPWYSIQINEEVFEVSGVQELADFSLIRNHYFNRCHIFLPRLKDAIWEGLLNEAFEAVEIVEAPSDSGPEGQLWAKLEQFCTGKVKGKSKGEILLGRPWTDEATGRTFFCSPDFMKFLDQQHFREFRAADVWRILKSRGAKHRQEKINGKNVTCWIIGKFEEQTEEFEQPPFTEEGL